MQSLQAVKSFLAMRNRILPHSIITAVLICVPSLANLNAHAQTDFAHDVLPILKSKCGKCHTNGTYKGGLSLDTRAALLDSGAVDLEKSGESEMLRRILSKDQDERMPPEGERLSEDEVSALRKWIDEGLSWPAELSLAEKKFERSLKLRRVLVGRDEHPIDSLVNRYFEANRIPALQPLEDHLFVRRAKLDLLGLLPTPEEVEVFKKDRSSIRYVKLVAKFLSRKRDYAEHWITFWNDLLRNDYVGTGYIDGGRKQITEWLYESLEGNKPYDLFVKQLISPTPASEGFIKGIKWRGRVNASQIEPLQFSQNVSQVFLGINMKCASCHDSFIDDWKLEDAYGMAAIASPNPLEIHRCDVATGQIAKSKFVFPGLGEISNELPREERLQKLSELIVDEENGRFARTIVNRIWERLVGRGLVHPVDVMANEAWSEDVLDWLAFDLIEHDYDLKRTMNLIATSNLYRSRSVGTDLKDQNDYVFQGVHKKRLTAEQLIDAIWQLTDSAPQNPDAKVSAGSSGVSLAKWIWKYDAEKAPAGEVVTFQFDLSLSEPPKSAFCVAACDNSYSLFINGKRQLKGKEWTRPNSADVTSALKVGGNRILVRCKNGGDSPNPAALAVDMIVENQSGRILRIASSETWRWTIAKTDNMGNAENASWTKSVVAPNGAAIYKSASLAMAKEIGRYESLGDSRVRASLVKSNLLMRSLGRPNREQVVTTRPAELSTLQALDLSNGEQLSSWLKNGANAWQERQKKLKWSNAELLRVLFEESLSRAPSQSELELLLPEEQFEKQDLEDILWMIIMLPEFQYVH